MADYRDPEPLMPTEPDYDQSKVDKRVRAYADHVRRKIYGVDVREALARGCEISALIAREAVDKANAMEESARRAEVAAAEAEADADRAEAAANKAENIADNLEGLTGKADEAEAKTGIADNKYMTPLKTFMAIDEKQKTINAEITSIKDNMIRRAASRPSAFYFWLRPRGEEGEI